eukprot:COSAG02_NODE_4_length_69935_cov_46.806590_41_plen_92_part_00
MQAKQERIARPSTTLGGGEVTSTKVEGLRRSPQAQSPHAPLYLGDINATPRGLNLSMTSSIPVNTRGQSDRNGYALTVVWLGDARSVDPVL